MDVMTFLVTIAAVVALTVQGLTCFSVKERAVAFGILNLGLAGVTVFVVVGICLGQLVIATELGAVLIQGSAARWWFRAALVAVAILPALWVYRLNCLNKWKQLVWPWIALGALVGTWAAFQVSAVAGSGSGELQVYAYDAFWPPFIIWLTICFAHCTLSLVAMKDTLMQAMFALALLTPLAMFVRRWPSIADNAGLTWAIIENIGLLGFLAASILFERRPENPDQGPAEPDQERAKYWAPRLAILGVGLIFPFLPLGLRWALALWPLLVLTVTIAAAFISEFQSLPFRQRWHERTTKQVQTNRLHATALSVSMLVIVLSLIDLFAVGLLPRALVVFLLFGSWLLLAEQLSLEGSLEHLPGRINDLLFQPAKRAASRVWNAVGGFKKACSVGLDKVSTGGSLAVAVKGVLLLVATLLILTAVSEVATYRQIVVRPFQWTGVGDPKDPKEEARAAAMSGLIVNAMGRLRNDLRPDIVNASRSLSGEHPANPTLLAAGGESTALGSAVAKSDELKIGGVSLNISFFVEPIQSIVRRLLGVRVVEGSIWRDGTNEDRVVLVNMSDGTSWRERATIPAPDAKPTPSCDGALPKDVDPTAALVEKVGFMIASTDKSFLAAGLTTNYHAFVPFRLGLTRWTSYESTGATADLNIAIDCFREAVRIDRRFAAANFRLGVALRAKREFRSAIDAFRESTLDNRGFVRGALQEAATRFEYASGLWDESRKGRDHQRTVARSIWQQIIGLPMQTVSFSERRAALLGLCQYALDELEQAPDGRGPTETYGPFFYCARGAALWSWTPARSRDDQERNVQANFLNVLAIALEKHHGQVIYRDAAASDPEWTCSAHHIEAAELSNQGAVRRFAYQASARSPIAIRLYRESLGYAPDDVVIRCNLASALRVQRDDHSEMRRLANTPEMRVLLATELEQRGALELPDGHNPPKMPPLDPRRWYERAVRELDAALEMDPMSIEARLRHAGMLHLRLGNQEGRSPSPSEWAVWMDAERRTREARRLCTAWRVPDELDKRASGYLGQILLAQGRAHEAILELQPLVDQPWLFQNQARGDLAQAKLCVARESQDASEVKKLRAEAIELFAKIVEDKRRGDTGAQMLADEFDPDLRMRSCVASPEQMTATDTPYQASSSVHEAGSICERPEIVAAVQGADPKSSQFRLRVWGGGIDTGIAIDGSGRVVRLDPLPQDTTRYYFARLEDASGKPLSTPVAIRAFRKGATCANSRVQLSFTPRPPPPSGQVRKTAT
jgi:tetratricopeptide (TPR) repeat protein